MSHLSRCTHAVAACNRDCVPVTRPAVTPDTRALDRRSIRPANENGREAPEHDRSPLTSCQRRIYDLIVASVRDRGYPPTLRELCAETGLHSTNGVTDHLRTLARKGYLVIDPGKARGLCLVDLDLAGDESVSVHEARQVLRDLEGVVVEPGSRTDLLARLARTVLRMAAMKSSPETAGQVTLCVGDPGGMLADMDAVLAEASR